MLEGSSEKRIKIFYVLFYLKQNLIKLLEDLLTK